MLCAWPPFIPAHRHLRAPGLQMDERMRSPEGCAELEALRKAGSSAGEGATLACPDLSRC